MTGAHVVLQPGADLSGFRTAVRRLIAGDFQPRSVTWSTNQAELLGESSLSGPEPPLAVPRGVSELASRVVCHRDGERFALLYELIWRVVRGERQLLEVESDPLVHRLARMAKAVSRDMHKMHAFVRFRARRDPDGAERYVAWFEPEHHIVEATADFFVERFPNMRWSILTPLGSLHWDGFILQIGPPGQRNDAPQSDVFEGAWRGYYESVFNPARLNAKVMRAHMPKKYWRNLPETAAIRGLVRGARARSDSMIARKPSLPAKRNPAKAVAAMTQQGPRTLEELNRLIAASQPLSVGADRAVFGEGPLEPPIALVGEQPGDEEERAGRPFVGPAGQVLDDALAACGIDRTKIYLTNAVKHFKCELRGKKRLHKRPNPGEVKRYRWWLMKELDLVRPRLVVALGSTAALALTGAPVPVTRARGRTTFGKWPGLITVHPSYLLRLREAEAREKAYGEFCADLALAKVAV